MNPIRYGKDTSAQFDARTCVVLDALREHFCAVDLETSATANGEPEWFVQVWKTADDELPTGCFGDTPYDAASRLASALGISFNETDTKPMEDE